MPAVTFIYVMSNVAYFAVLSPAQVIESDAVAVVSGRDGVGGRGRVGGGRGWVGV